MAQGNMAALQGLAPGVGVAVITSSPRGPKGGLHQESLDVVTKALGQAATAVNKVGDSWAPWKASKNKERSEQALSELTRSQSLVVDVLKVHQERAARFEAENNTLRAEHDKLKAENAELQSTVESLRGEVSELQDVRDSKTGNMAALINKVEGATPGGRKRYLKMDGDKEVELLQSRVEVMIKELEKLRTENDKLSHARVELNKRIKDLQDKMRDEAEVHEREARRVNLDIKKAHDDRESAVAAAKAEGAEQLAVRAREIKALQKRLDAQKAEIEMLKGREHTAKTQAEELSATATKAQTQARDAVRKANEAKCEREDFVAQLALAREEMAMLQAEYAQLSKAHTKEVGRPSGSGVSCVKPDAPWPRQAFTVRGSCVLHTAACPKASDVTRMEAREYRSAAELEGWLAEGRLVLCTACKTHGF